MKKTEHIAIRGRNNMWIFNFLAFSQIDYNYCIYLVIMTKHLFCRTKSKVYSFLCQKNKLCTWLLTMNNVMCLQPCQHIHAMSLLKQQHAETAGLGPLVDLSHFR